jgi:hypothetical protein
VCLLTGTFRRGAYASTVVVTLTGDDATPIPAGNIGRVANGPKFTTKPTRRWPRSAWGAYDSYALNASRRERRQLLPVHHGRRIRWCGRADDNRADIVDGTAHWRFLGEGVAAASDVLPSTRPRPGRSRRTAAPSQRS